MRFHEIINETELAMDGASRAARAKEQGFTTIAYHGTNQKFNEFSIDFGKPSVMGGHGINFADDHDEAKGYAKDLGRKGHVMTVLLRVKKAFPAWYGDDTLISVSDYKKIVGRPPENASDRVGKNVLRELEDQIGWADKRGFWTQVYARLAKAGFDALYYKNVPGDHVSSYYNKFIIFDPRNIRLIDAAFDPAKSNSADLRG